MKRLLADMNTIKALALELSRCKEVARYDNGSEHEAWTLAHALSDIEEAVAKIYGEKIPRLLFEGHSSDEINILLLEIGEELRHILYHIRDPKYFQYIAVTHNANGRTE